MKKLVGIKFLKKSKKGFSLIEIIIAIVIMGIIAALGAPTLNTVLENSKAPAEKTILNNIASAIQTVHINNNYGSLTAFDVTTKAEMLEAISSLPKEFEYRVGITKSGSNTAYFATATADYTLASEKSKLLSIASSLEATYDGDSNSTGGQFQYDTTCSASNDCYYAYYVYGSGITKSSDTWFDSATAVATDGQADDITDDGLTFVKIN
jgi:prepilin-type N-terminal cleavage/methylation domain-containing protein